MSNAVVQAMTEQKKVSVVMIFLDAEKFIGDAIESVLAQTYDTWELLLVDDGSTDSSTSIARAYADRLPKKIRYLEHPGHRNLGKSASRNLGVRRASGDYIALLDSDDVFLPQKLARQVAILDRHPEAAMVYGPTLYWYGWTEKAQDLARDRMGELGVVPDRIYHPPELMTLFLNHARYLPCTCAWMVRKEALDPEGGSEEGFRKLYEDQVFLAKIVLNYPVFVESGSWDKYRQHPDMGSNRAVETGEYSRRQPHLSQHIYYKWLSTYIDKQRISDKSLRAALKKQTFIYDHPILWRLLLKWRTLINRVRWFKSRIGSLTKGPSR
jgi:glycosyltransferase involved in cell wall biosynthesis